MSAVRTPRQVDRACLEHQLEALRVEVSGDAGVAGPRQGLFGPQTKLWQVNREALIFLGSGRAALLQLAHPAVAAAIDRFSSTRSDPYGRFHRTFRRVFAMVWGDLDSALGAARRVHQVHVHIHGTLPETLGAWRAGTSYIANDPAALLWVHATLWETSIRVYESFVRPLEESEKESYYRDTLRFARLFGLDPASLPSSWAEFMAYNQDMWQRLEPGCAARDIGGFLFEPHGWGTGLPLRWLRVLSTALLPDVLRQGFGLEYGRREQRVFAASRWLIQHSYRAWPRRLRYVPPYLEALRRLQDDQRRDRVGEWLTRLWLGPSPPIGPDG